MRRCVERRAAPGQGALHPGGHLPRQRGRALLLALRRLLRIVQGHGEHHGTRLVRPQGPYQDAGCSGALRCRGQLLGPRGLQVLGGAAQQQAAGRGGAGGGPPGGGVEGAALGGGAELRERRAQPSGLWCHQPPELSAVEPSGHGDNCRGREFSDGRGGRPEPSRPRGEPQSLQRRSAANIAAPSPARQCGEGRRPRAHRGGLPRLHRGRAAGHQHRRPDDNGPPADRQRQRLPSQRRPRLGGDEAPDGEPLLLPGGEQCCSGDLRGSTPSCCDSCSCSPSIRVGDYDAFV
mmetsp:Transcript_124163/g.386657  ORF Transcript_124163/g.386657 Transcript_124163/m.386657 type:complete len:291 (+) Transcript_124163:674-1546(+)